MHHFYLDPLCHVFFPMELLHCDAFSHLFRPFLRTLYDTAVRKGGMEKKILTRKRTPWPLTIWPRGPKSGFEKIATAWPSEKIRFLTGRKQLY